MPRPLKIELTITNKWLFFFVLVLVIAISIGVWAYTQAIPSPGHGGNEIWISVGGEEMTLQQAIDNENLFPHEYSWGDCYWTDEREIECGYEHPSCAPGYFAVAMWSDLHNCDCRGEDWECGKVKWKCCKVVPV